MARFPRSRPRSAAGPSVVLVDEGWWTTPYVATKLRDVGCTIHVATATHDPGIIPRPGELGPGITCERLPPVRDPAFIPALSATLSARPAAVLFPMTETVLYRLWSETSAWEERTFPQVEPWQRALLRDKSALSRFAGEHGVRVPGEYPLQSAEDIRTGIGSLGLPIVVKGVTGIGGGSVRVAETEAEALEAFTAFARWDRCFLQQYIDGPTFYVGGIFMDGEPLRLYGAEVLEKRPLVTGPSIRLRSSTDARMLAPAVEAARALRWTGPTAINVIRGSDGEYYFLEFNPRPWGSMDAGEKVGVDFFVPLATLLAGGVPEPDLGFRDGVESAVFMKFALDRLERGGMKALGTIALEPRAWLDLPWKDRWLLVFALKRLRWEWQNRTADRRRARRAGSVEGAAPQA